MSVPADKPRPPAAVNIPLDPPVASSEVLAKRFLVALIAQRSLARSAELPIGRVADIAPRLCALVLSALHSDAELERIGALSAPSPVRRPGDEPGALQELHELVAAVVDFADAPELAGAVSVVEALRTVLWASLADHVVSLTPSQAGDLANRLAHVCAVLAAAAVANADATPDVGVSAAPAAGQSERYPRIELRANGSSPEHADDDDLWAVPPTEVDAEAEVPRAGAEAAVEREGVAEAPAAGSEAQVPQAGAEPEPAPDRQPHSEPQPRPQPPATPQTPFAVLLIEVLGAERLRQADPSGDAAALFDAVHAALRGALRPLDLLEREAAGRWWLLAPAANVLDGRLLAERLVQIVRTAAWDRHAPLEVVVGVAAAPDHGTGAVELGERAEEELYAARAAGVSVMPATTSAVPAS